MSVCACARLSFFYVCRHVCTCVCVRLLFVACGYVHACVEVCRLASTQKSERGCHSPLLPPAQRTCFAHACTQRHAHTARHTFIHRKPAHGRTHARINILAISRSQAQPHPPRARTAVDGPPGTACGSALQWCTRQHQGTRWSPACGHA